MIVLVVVPEEVSPENRLRSSQLATSYILIPVSYPNEASRQIQQREDSDGLHGGIHIKRLVREA